MRVGINGMGRIGRLALRAAMGGLYRPADDPRAGNRLDVVHVNELKGGAATTAHLLEFDSIHGRWRESFGVEDERAIRSRQSPHRLQRRADARMPSPGAISAAISCWNAPANSSRPEQLDGYFARGVKRVIVAAPVKEAGALNIVVGVNDHLYEPREHRLLTAASCTTNCLAPVVKVLHEAIGIRHGQITTIHDPDQHQCRDRCAAQGSAARALGDAVAVADHDRQRHRDRADLSRAQGQAERPCGARAGAERQPHRLRVRDGSARSPTNEVNELFRGAAAGPLAGILGFEARPLVSADYANDTRSAIVDGPSTMVTDDTLLKVYAWYDNEVGYACRMVDLANIVIERSL